MSRRRPDRAPKAHAPTSSTSDDFSDQELDFFKRGDELHPPSDSAETPEADA